MVAAIPTVSEPDNIVPVQEMVLKARIRFGFLFPRCFYLTQNEWGTPWENIHQFL